MELNETQLITSKEITLDITDESNEIWFDKKHNIRPSEMLSAPNLDELNSATMVDRNGSSYALNINPGTHLFSALPKNNLEERFKTLQKWEGVVDCKNGDTFVARLKSIKGDSGQKETEAKIFIEDVPQNDRKYIEPGAVFYWSIGYLDKRSGQRMRGSIIRFRRLTSWTKKDTASAKRKMVEIRELINEE